MEWHHREFCITTKRERNSVYAVYRFLSLEAHWSKGIPRETVERSLDNSLCFLYFAAATRSGSRASYPTAAPLLISATVLAEYRWRGLSKWLMKCVMSHPELQRLRRWILLTADAHGLYAQSGFTSLPEPDRWMQRHDPAVYPPKD